ncbi:Nlpd [Buchnera aphidicola str. G002 (Myzus persicae)]|uniref:peptidoglycan DD-metalloendopeptidase family protein n=1 Tax=Buchnera aphidicola TaxID=9 RepID=UPI0003E339FC|nr:peptidoglycan DD-metalloendopeptidase family protein [Buchnera aphidicola]AHG61217.1 Nlpd [Buchnera aphidicola str. G002 (Myzus persicae)]
MQQTCKIFFLKIFGVSFFYNIIIIFINSLVALSFLSSCNILFYHPIKNFPIRQERIKKNTNIKETIHKIDNIKKNYYKINKREKKIHTLLDMSGVNTNEILKLIRTDSNLKNLKNGQKLSWKVNSSGKLLELEWQLSKFQKKIYKNINNNFCIFNLLLKKTITIKKKSNFFKSAIESGLSKSEINNVIQAIRWQIDFQKLDIGSHFNVIFLHNSRNNNNILLGVKLDNFGKKYYSIRASNGDFYNLYGFNTNICPISLSFLKKYRISSQFNLHRLNPVTHRITQHLGVDLAMPQGTPILATSNGKIIKAQFNKIAGFYISLKNKNDYITRYMHLKKILVKIGDKVKMGQKIALSGNTGRTTGPHLHYEIWINNHPIDPIKFKCIPNKRMTKEEEKILQYLQ